jgi:hypothetical protein
LLLLIEIALVSAFSPSLHVAYINLNWYVGLCEYFFEKSHSWYIAAEVLLLEW